MPSSNPDDIAFGTVASIAQAADVQPSTLVRFSQAMGYPGFSQLQDVFRSRLRERILNYEERLEQLREHAASASKAHIIFEGFSEAFEKSIHQLRDRIDPAQLDRAVDILASADTVYLIGLRRSYPISSYMAYAFGKLGVRHVLVQATGGLAQEEIGFAGTARCRARHQLHPLCQRNSGAGAGRGGPQGAAAYPSPIPASRRSLPFPTSGSKWRKQTSRASAPWRQPSRSP